MVNTLQQLVVRRLKELGLGPVEAAARGGLERTYIRDIVDGRKSAVRSDKIATLARALEIDPSVFSSELRRSETGIRMVRVKAFVQAGHWAESAELAQEDQREIPVPADPDLAGFGLHAAVTRGPSMNRKYPDGTVLVFTDAIETQEEIAVGKRYVVERERADGKRETTVKKLWRDDLGKLWLLPESDDPRFQEPLPVDGAEGETIRIVGRVRYAVSRE